MSYNPQAHLENPELLNQKRELDEEYNKPLNISLEEQKQQLKDSLYGNTEFNDESGTKSQEEIEKKEKLQNKQKNLKNCIKDIDKISSSNKLDKELFEVVNGSFESEVLNKIGGNYLKTPLENGEFDIDNDFSSAIIETRDEIELECANLKMGSETYNVAIKNIESSDIKQQLEGIETLYYLAYSNEGKLGKTQIDNFKKKKKDKLIKEAEGIENKLNSEEIKTNQELKEKLEQRKKEIINQMSELTGVKNGENFEDGDVFKANKIELNKEKKED